MIARKLAACLMSILIAGGLARARDAGAAETEPSTGAAGLDDGDRALVKRIENYIEDIHTLRARFHQQSSNGTTATGKVWLKRPGKVRFDYDPPKNTVMVANGEWLLYFNRRRDQTSYIPISETPLYPLLKKDVQILGTGAFSVAEVARTDGLIRATVVRGEGKPDQPGSLTLFFTQRPLSLVRWRLVDQQGTVTAVDLTEIQRGIAIPASKFSFQAMDLPETPKGK